MAGDNSIDSCLSCMNPIGRREKKIKCDGVCDKFIHVECSGISIEIAQFIEDNDNIFYTCDACKKFSLRDINTKINGIVDLLSGMKESDKKRDIEINEMKKYITDINEQMKPTKLQNMKERDKHTNTPRGNGTVNGNNNASNRNVASTSKSSTSVSRLSLSKVNPVVPPSKPTPNNNSNNKNKTNTQSNGNGVQSNGSGAQSNGNGALETPKTNSNAAKKSSGGNNNINNKNDNNKNEKKRK